MSADILAWIFDPFFTIKPGGIGIGLGLPMARNLVASYGGGLDASSQPGRGSCFHLRSPMVIVERHYECGDTADEAGATRYQDRT